MVKAKLLTASQQLAHIRKLARDRQRKLRARRSKPKPTVTQTPTPPAPDRNIK